MLLDMVNVDASGAQRSVLIDVVQPAAQIGIIYDSTQIRLEIGMIDSVESNDGHEQTNVRFCENR